MKRPSLYFYLCIAVMASALAMVGIAQTITAVEAPAGFDTPTLNQNHGSQSVSNGMDEPAGDTFATDQTVFEEEDGVDNGLGPVYNARGCVDCHQNPVTGGASIVSELRVGHRDRNGDFVNPTITINNGASRIPDRSLVNDRAICAEAQERVPGEERIHALRATTNTLGDGFVEAIDSNMLVAIANSQPGRSNGAIAGQFIQVPVFEAPGQTRIGRFGWKDQQASLLSFAADAYVNEQGITSRLQPTDTTSVCDNVADPEDHPDSIGMADIDHFAQFMRATKVPPRDPVLSATADARAGEQIFHAIGCDICHVSSITTAPAGTVVNGGTFTVPEALGGKTIHPYSDFLLHNVGTGDGIVQNGPQSTANKMRTTPLWGDRTRSRLMHDLLSFTRHDAILRHGGEATGVTNRYRALTKTQKEQLITFLESL